MCSVSSLYGDQAITGLLKSYKGWGKVLWEIQFEFKIQIELKGALDEPSIISYKEIENENISVL